MKLWPGLFFLFLMVVLVNPSGVEAKVRVFPVFSKAINSPSSIEYCMDRLWIYSEDTKHLYTTSKTSQPIRINKDWNKANDLNITALGCYKEQLVIAAQANRDSSKKGSPLLFLLKVSGTISKLPYVTADKGHIRDIECRNDTCIFIQDRVHILERLTKNKEINLPHSRNISRQEKFVKGNPFADWQDKLVWSKGKYFRSLILPSGLYFLDSLQTSVVFTKDHEKIESYRKWGKWGRWEGTFIYPKGLAYLEEGKSIIVSDVGTKLISIFDLYGKYKGSFGADGKRDRFLYPRDIVAHNNTLYVADFLGNRVYRFDIPKSYDIYENNEVTSVKDLLHQNLFHNEKVISQIEKTRCLNCHDGLETHSLGKFLKLKFHHPIGEKVEKEIDLPLSGNKTMSCNTCHNTHHISMTGKSYDFFGQQKKTKKIGSYLRKPPVELCITCHQGKNKKALNHFSIRGKLIKGQAPVQIVSCLQCHSMHSGEEKKLTRFEFNSLCLSCHGDKSPVESHPLDEKTKCLSCHSVHGGELEFHYAKYDQKKHPYSCVNCHKKMKKHLGSNDHLKPKKRFRHSWPNGDSACLDCHNPHRQNASIERRCTTCHRFRGQQHPKLNPVSSTYRAKDIRLHKTSITCTTCHDQHGNSTPGYIRDRWTLLPFCASCHGKETKVLFEKYHKKLKH